VIPRAELPSISLILSHLDIPPGRRGRTRCPIHKGDNAQVFSYDDSKGRWFCFRCGIGGDAIALVENALDLDFKGALCWIGLTPGQPPKLHPEAERRKLAKAGLTAWAKKMGRELRDEFYLRSMIEFHGTRRLRSNPDDFIGWWLLSIAYNGVPLCELERRLDLLIGKEEQQLEIFRQWRSAP
jgi:hypothetical protein